jgi:hypothetical protein
MPTFGKTATGASSLGFTANEVGVNRSILNEPGIVTMLSVIVQGATANVKLRCVIYADNGADAPGALKGVTAETTVTSGQAKGLVDLLFPAPISLPPGKYWIGFWSDGGGGSNGLRFYDVGAAGVFQFKTAGFPYSSTNNPPDPFGAATTSGGNEQFTVFGTYTYSGPDFLRPLLGGPGQFGFPRGPFLDRQLDDFPAAGPHLLALGMATETDTAGTIGALKTKAVATATATEAALAFTRSRSRLAGVAAETDLAVALVKQKARLLGVGLEIDAAPAVTRVRLRLLGTAAETDALVAFTRRKTRTLGLAAETDTTFALGRRKMRLLSIATDLEVALALAVLGGFGLHGFVPGTLALAPRGRGSYGAAVYGVAVYGEAGGDALVLAPTGPGVLLLNPR